MMHQARFIVAVASRAIFDLDAEHAVFEREGVAGYVRIQAEREADPPAPGPAFGLVDGLSRINEAAPDAAHPLVDIVVVSRNDPGSGLRFLNGASAHGLGATRAVMTGGRPVAPVLRGLDVDLFLTRSPSDGAEAAALGVPTAVLADGSPHVPFEGELRIAYDGDAVLFDDASERAYVEGGYAGWHAYERAHAGVDLAPGPIDRFARKLAALRGPAASVGVDLRCALVTARDGPARGRAVTSLRARGIDLDAGFFLGGLSKGAAMSGFRPHLFLDDKAHNVAAVAGHAPSGLVPSLGGAGPPPPRPAVPEAER